MKSTGVKMLIAAEELSSIPGLEEWGELLFAERRGWGTQGGR